MEAVVASVEALVIGPVAIARPLARPAARAPTASAALFAGRPRFLDPQLLAVPRERIRRSPATIRRTCVTA